MIRRHRRVLETSSRANTADLPLMQTELAHRCRKRRDEKPIDAQIEINADVAEKRAIDFLRDTEHTVEGARNSTAYGATCWVKDFGVPEEMALDLMLDWNETKAIPPLSPGEIEQVVGSAYSKGMIGKMTAEAEGFILPFEPEVPKAAPVSELKPNRTNSTRLTVRPFPRDGRSAPATAVNIKLRTSSIAALCR